MSETEAVSDVLSTLFILFVGYVIVRAHGVVDGSILDLAFEFVKFAAVVVFVLAVVGLLVQALD